MHLAFES